MKSNVEKEFNTIYKEAGKKRSRSLQGTYWGISDVIEYFESKNMRAETIAGNFAAKEAIVKAMGTGFSGFGAETSSAFVIRSPFTL